MPGLLDGERVGLEGCAEDQGAEGEEEEEGLLRVKLKVLGVLWGAPRLGNTVTPSIGGGHSDSGVGHFPLGFGLLGGDASFSSERCDLFWSVVQVGASPILLAHPPGRFRSGEVAFAVEARLPELEHGGGVCDLDGLSERIVEGF